MTYDRPASEQRIVGFLNNLLESSCLELEFRCDWSAEASRLTLSFEGPDVWMLVSDESGLLKAIEHLVAQLCVPSHDDQGTQCVSIVIPEQEVSGEDRRPSLPA